MIGIVRHLLVTLLLCAMCQHGVSQAPQQTGFAEPLRKAVSSTSTFVPYACKHKSCDDVAEVLRPLLPSPNENPGIQLVVDRDGNRLLLMGPADVHDLATSILQEVDRPAANLSMASATDSSRSVKAYKLPARLHETLIRDLQTRFGAAVRISDDANSGNVFVSATSELHSDIAATVASYTGELQTTLPRQNQLIRYRETTGTVPQGNLQNASNVAVRNRTDNSRGSQPVASDYPRFVRVPNGQMDRIQQQLMAIFSTRLQVRTVQGRQVFTLQTTGETPAHIDIEFDRLRSGVLVDGVGPAPMQLTVLIQSLSNSDGRGRGMKVFGLRRDNHQRLRSVIESGSVNYRNRPQFGRSGAAFRSSSSQFPRSTGAASSALRGP